MKRRGFILTLTALMIMAVCILTVSVLEKREMDDIKKIYAGQGKQENHTLKREKDEAEVQQGEDRTSERNTVEEGSTGPIEKMQFETYVFVGDSRYKGMSVMAGDNDIFICESGRGYDFLTEQMSYIRSVCDENTALIIGLGVNDTASNAEKYISTLNQMADEMDCRIYYMLVNPVDEAKEQYNGYDVRNSDIRIFNDRIREGMDETIGIIDTNTYLIQSGYETQDGLHYTDATYEKIYNYIKREISG